MPVPNQLLRLVPVADPPAPQPQSRTPHLVVYHDPDAVCRLLLHGEEGDSGSEPQPIDLLPVIAWLIEDGLRHTVDTASAALPDTPAQLTGDTDGSTNELGTVEMVGTYAVGHVSGDPTGGLLDTFHEPVDLLTAVRDGVIAILLDWAENNTDRRGGGLA